MSCNDPGATHHAGCECWEERRRKELERLLRIERIAGAFIFRAMTAADDVTQAKAAEVFSQLWGKPEPFTRTKVDEYAVKETK